MTEPSYPFWKSDPYGSSSLNYPLKDYYFAAETSDTKSRFLLFYNKSPRFQVMPQHVSRVQFVLSGWSLGFFVLSLGLLTGGYWLYTHQPQPQAPPYYVSRTATAVRPCFQCLAIDGKMKESKDWRL